MASKKFGPAWLLALVLLIGTSCRYEYKGAILDPPKPIADFTLDAHDGSTFRLSDYRGRIVLVYFGYTFCPDVCPATLYQVSQAMKKLGQQADQVQVVMVTVDPARDTPEQQAAYLKSFGESFLGLRTTDLDRLDAVLAEFGATYFIEGEIDDPSGYLVTHTASLFVVDREGRLREIITFGTSADDIASDLRHLLREK